MEDKKDIRKNYYYHPEYGVVTENGAGGYYYQHARVHDSKDGELETLYQRDRRLWVEQLLSRKIADFTLSINAFDTEQWTVKAMAAYDKIQEVNFSFNQ
jgi:hypothetical protein